MEKEINIDAIIGMAVTTAFMRCNWNNDTHSHEISDWSEITDLAEEYCTWVGLEDVDIDEHTVRESIWGETA